MPHGKRKSHGHKQSQPSRRRSESHRSSAGPKANLKYTRKALRDLNRRMEARDAPPTPEPIEVPADAFTRMGGIRCGNKTRHRSRWAAALAASAYSDDHPDEQVSFYECDLCGSWHVGHEPGSRRTG